MITEELWRKISNEWDKSEKYYQKWHKEYKRFLHFNSVAPIFKDRNVLEIGTNAGIQSLEICEHCNSFVGIEKNPIFFEQLRKTMAHTNKPKILLNMGLEEFSETEDSVKYDSLFMSFVMYHFSDKEVDILRSKILPKISTIVVYNRAGDRKVRKNKYDFFKLEPALDLFKSEGFETQHEWQSQKIWYCIKGTK